MRKRAVDKVYLGFAFLSTIPYYLSTENPPRAVCSCAHMDAIVVDNVLAHDRDKIPEISQMSKITCGTCLKGTIYGII